MFTCSSIAEKEFRVTFTCGSIAKKSFQLCLRVVDSRKRVSSYVYIWFDNMKIDYFSLSFDHCSSIANNSLSIVNVTPQLWIVN